MTQRDILDEYHDYLCDLMCLNTPEHRMYRRLLYRLDERAFTYSVYLDKNRELDGYLLREEFLFDNGYDQSDIWHGHVSVLEVLTAISKRIETEITGDLGNDKLDRWFWVMIDNLGLDKFTDERFNVRRVDDILDRWMRREFDRDGVGSPFPLKSWKGDVRMTDLWYQMQLYLSENWEY